MMGGQGGHNFLVAEKSQKCQKYFLEYSTFPLLVKDLRFEHESTKLVSCPGHHLTLVCPWVHI